MDKECCKAWSEMEYDESTAFIFCPWCGRKRIRKPAGRPVNMEKHIERANRPKPSLFGLYVTWRVSCIKAGYEFRGVKIGELAKKKETA